MSVLATEALVLHSFDYLESSRIVRLLTREAGVRTVLARGARRSSRRFGTAIDLFAQGFAELETKPGRDLDNLYAFDIQRGRPFLGGDLGRFSAASALAELAIRFASDDTNVDLFETMSDVLDELVIATTEQARLMALAGAWRLLATLGFSPSLDQCTDCHGPVPDDEPALFNHAAGGVLCAACAQISRAGRPIPPEARQTIRGWLTHESWAISDSAARAHQRLLREFVHQHLDDGRPLRAFAMWEHASWSAQSHGDQGSSV